MYQAIKIMLLIVQSLILKLSLLFSHKAPGLDSIPAFFYQDYWDTVKFDVFSTVQAFFHSGSLLKSFNHTFITLIPKKSFPDNVNQFRPTSLCNVIYKVISKILVNRLKPLMDQLVTPYQNAFIKGRNISDNILIAHEIFGILSKKKGRKYGYGVLKIDMSKAYDRIDWKFLKAVLVAMNFSPRWIGWVMECVSTVQFTLLVNGSITQTFKPSKGLRQGDPISPYLFLLCANVLSIPLLKVEHNKAIQGIKVGRNGCTFTHLFFADDSLLFFKKDNKSLQNIHNILQWYCNLSGQNINLAKSDLFCSSNMPEDEQLSLANSFQVNLVKNPSKYLGLEFKLKGKRVSDFQFLVDKLKSKLQSWKARLLSQAGRGTLITSVL